MRTVRRAAIALVAMIISFVSLMPAGLVKAGAAGGVVEISSAGELMAIADAPSGSYRLTADIDMGGADWQPIPFSGKLDGDGHTLYNLKITSCGTEKRVTRDGNLKEYDTEFAGLFSVMENAEVTRLNIVGARLEITGSTHCFAALLAGYSDRSKVTDCYVDGRAYFINNGVNAGLGGIVGYGSGDFEKCRADVELVFEDRKLDAKCEEFLGGVISCGIGSIIGCQVKIDGYVSCHGYVHNGGLVGMYFHCGTDVERGKILNNRVDGRISFFEDNTDRRAYCKAFGGELLTPPLKKEGNVSFFTSDETKDYSKVLMPEKCEAPEYSEPVTPPDCTHWGSTLHTCSGCGYSWTDSYTPPAHEWGEWVIVSGSDYEREGLKRQYCLKCGELVGEEAIPVLVKEPEPDKSEEGQEKLNRIAVWGGIAFVAVSVAFFSVRAVVKSRRRKDE